MFIIRRKMRDAAKRVCRRARGDEAQMKKRERGSDVDAMTLLRATQYNRRNNAREDRRLPCSDAVTRRRAPSRLHR